MRIMSGSIIRNGGAVRVTTNAIVRDEHDREAIRHITTTTPDRRVTVGEMDELKRGISERDEMLELVKSRRNAMLAEKAACIDNRPGRIRRAVEMAKTAIAIIIATMLFSVPAWYDEHRESVETWTMALGILVTTILWAWALAKIALNWGWIG